MFKVLRYTNGMCSVVCECDNKENARVVEFALDLALRQAGGAATYFGILDVDQHAIIHLTKSSEN